MTNFSNHYTGGTVYYRKRGSTHAGRLKKRRTQRTRSIRDRYSKNKGVTFFDAENEILCVYVFGTFLANLDIFIAVDFYFLWKLFYSFYLRLLLRSEFFIRTARNHKLSMSRKEPARNILNDSLGLQENARLSSQKYFQPVIRLSVPSSFMKTVSMMLVAAISVEIASVCVLLSKLTQMNVPELEL